MWSGLPLPGDDDRLSMGDGGTTIPGGHSGHTLSVSQTGNWVAEKEKNKNNYLN